VPSVVAPIVLGGAFPVNRCPSRVRLIRHVSWRVSQEARFPAAVPRSGVDGADTMAFSTSTGASGRRATLSRRGGGLSRGRAGCNRAAPPGVPPPGVLRVPLAPAVDVGGDAVRLSTMAEAACVGPGYPHSPATAGADPSRSASSAPLPAPPAPIFVAALPPTFVLTTAPAAPAGTERGSPHPRHGVAGRRCAHRRPLQRLPAASARRHFVSGARHRDRCRPIRRRSGGSGAWLAAELKP